MYAQAVGASDLTEQSVAGQQDAMESERGKKTEAIVGGEGGMALFKCEGASDLVRCKVVGDHSGIVK